MMIIRETSKILIPDTIKIALHDYESFVIPMVFNQKKRGGVLID